MEDLAVTKDQLADQTFVCSVCQKPGTVEDGAWPEKVSLPGGTEDLAITSWATDHLLSRVPPAYVHYDCMDGSEVVEETEDLIANK